MELAAAEALLEKSVSVPFKRIRVPFTDKGLTIRFTMRRPRLGGQIRISKHYIKLGMTHAQIMALTPDQEMEFMARHGKRLSKMIALTVCRGWISGWLFTPIVAFLIRQYVDPRFILGAHDTYLSFVGVKSFNAIIRSAEEQNPMRPTVSHKMIGS
jgi:hypothetical protein